MGGVGGEYMKDLNDLKDNAIETKEVKEETKKQTVSEMELEIKKIELETKKLEMQERTANLQDLKERLDERELKRENKRQRSLTNGQTLKQLALNDAKSQSKCNHKKGGDGAAGIVGGQGDDSQYAIIKHQFHNGDIWIRCLRCGKTYKPPMKEHMSVEEFATALAEYKEALGFSTRNKMSGSIMFKYSDGGAYARDTMANTTLR